MPSLLSCWCIIENGLTPDGSRKWQRLSYFIHPFLLVFCQIFLWVKYFVVAVLIILCYVIYTLGCILSTLNFVFKYLRTNLAWIIFVIRDWSTDQVGVQEEVWYDVSEYPDQPLIQNILSLDFSRVQPDRSERETLDFYFKFPAENEVNQSNFIQEEFVNVEQIVPIQYREMENQLEQIASNFIIEEVVNVEQIVPVQYREMENQLEQIASNFIIEEVVNVEQSAPVQNRELGKQLMPIASFKEQEEEEEQVQENEKEEEYKEEKDEKEDCEVQKEIIVVDEVYHPYVERMRLFDLKIQQLTCGISYVLNNNMRGVSDEIYLVSSIEADLERAYVGQTCISWDALQQQYMKVEALAYSNSIRESTYHSIAKQFQQFQVLLERFMENERNQRKIRILNYVESRLSCKRLMQVPEVAGTETDYLEKKWEGFVGQEIFSRQAMKVVENAIETFWLFLISDGSTKKTSCKPRNSSKCSPQVEDPKDLELLFSLKSALEKKEVELKGCTKQRWWWKRKGQVKISHGLEVLFAKIDIEVVGRVLRMCLLFTMELKWCQQKLSSLEIKEGKVRRASSSSLFPL